MNLTINGRVRSHYVAGAVVTSVGIAVLAFLGTTRMARSQPGGPLLADENESAVLSPAKPYSGKTIRIGLFGSLTGSTAVFGVATEHGVKMAFDEVNARGGVLGRKIELISRDNGSHTENVPETVRQLIEEDRVLALLGEVASSRSLAAAPVAQAAKVPMVSPSSTNPKVTQVGDYIFRTCVIDPVQGTAMARFARRTLKKKSAAILTEVANDYSKGLTRNFQNEWKKLGGRIVADESYAEGDMDFRSQLMRIKARRPEVLYVPGYYTEVASIAVQARRLGVRQVILGGDGWDSPQLFATAGAAIRGCYFTNHFSEQQKSPRVNRFVTDYTRIYHEKPDALSASGYDAARVLADAIQRGGSLDRAQVRAALARTKKFPGVTGDITIDAARNAVKPVVVMKVDGPDGKFVASVQP